MILFISCAEPLENYKGYIVAKKYFINENRVLLKYFDVNTMKYKYVKVWALKSQINQYQVDNTNSFTAYDIFKIDNVDQNQQHHRSQKIAQSFTEIFSRFINGHDLNEHIVSNDNDCGIYEAYTRRHNRNYIELADTNSIQDKGYSLYRINNDTTFIFIEKSFFVPIIIQWLKTANEIVDFQFGTKDEYVCDFYKNKSAAYTALLSPNSIYNELEEKRKINDNSNICLLGAILPYGLDGRILHFNNIKDNANKAPTIIYIPTVESARKYPLS